MYYYKARIYSPTLGRFLQTDPIGCEDEFNLHAYAANDPVEAVDFGGMCPWCRIIQIGENVAKTGSNSMPPRATCATTLRRTRGLLTAP